MLGVCRSCASTARNRGTRRRWRRTVGAYGAMAATFLAGLGYAKATGKTRARGST
jgi:hypothetical protein